MTEDTNSSGNEALDLDQAENRAPGAFGQHDAHVGRQGGVNQGTDEAGELSVEEAEIRKRKSAIGDMVDDNAASHQGGMGAQSGQADYGSAGNLSGGIGGGSGGQ